MTFFCQLSSVVAVEKSVIHKIVFVGNFDFSLIAVEILSLISVF